MCRFLIVSTALLLVSLTKLHAAETEIMIVVGPSKHPPGTHEVAAGGPPRLVLTYETDLPFPDLSVDRMLLVHSLECTDDLKTMLREVDGSR